MNEKENEAVWDFVDDFKTELQIEFIEKFEDEWFKFCKEQYYEYVDICNTKYN